MIPSESLTDALAADLRDAFIEAEPINAFAPERVLLALEDLDLPSPRLVITCGDPRRIKGMDYTARIPFELEFVSPIDRTVTSDHRAQVGKIAAWLVELKAKRRQLLACRVFLHDLYTLQPMSSKPSTEREGVTSLRGEAIVTLAEVEL